MQKTHRDRPGFLVGIGAPFPVVGVKEFRLPLQRASKRMRPLRPSMRRFCFA